MSEADYNTIQAMLKYGGSFVVALAQAAQQADTNNLRKIKETWPEYWQQYTEMAK